MKQVGTLAAVVAPLIGYVLRVSPEKPLFLSPPPGTPPRGEAAAKGFGITTLVLCGALVVTALVIASCGSADGTAKYQLTQILDTAPFDGHILGFEMIPGAEGEAVVLAQAGTIWRVPLSADGTATVFADFSDRSTPLEEGILTEAGLLGLAFSPDYQQDHRVYIHYTTPIPLRGVISRFQVVDGVVDMTSEHPLLEVPQPSAKHNGGQLAFGPDGYLYIGLGEGAEDEPDDTAQNLSSLLGAILRLDVSGRDYRVPPDNPFVDQPNARPEIYAYGLRNPWRFSFDSVTGELWAGDVGAFLWEEVDRIVPGGNYGWRITEGLECFNTAACDKSGFQAPRAVYGHDDGCSVTGGYVYRGSAMPELHGWYLYGDFCTGRIWAVDTTDDSKPALLMESGQLITSFGELPDGELVVLTWANQIFRIDPAP